MTLNEFINTVAISQTVKIQAKTNGIDIEKELTVQVRDYIHSPSKEIKEFRSDYQHWEIHCIRVENGVLTVDATLYG